MFHLLYPVQSTIYTGEVPNKRAFSYVAVSHNDNPHCFFNVICPHVAVVTNTINFGYASLLTAVHNLLNLKAVFLMNSNQQENINEKYEEIARDGASKKRARL
jgi:hypothetical protein